MHIVIEYEIRHLEIDHFYNKMSTYSYELTMLHLIRRGRNEKKECEC